MKKTAIHRLGIIMAGCALGLAFSATGVFAADPPARTLLAGTPPARAAIPDEGDISDRTGIAATVNDDAITFSDIRNRLDLYLSGNPQKPPPEVRHKLELQVLDKLIDEKLQLQEAKKEGITVTDDDIKNGFDQIARQNNLSTEEFRHKLDAMGVKVSSLTDQIRAEVAWTQVVRRKLRPDVNVTESEIDNALAQLTRSKASNEYLVAEIFLPVPGPEMVDSVRHDAYDIIGSIQHGENFAEVARKFSKAPGAASGGDLGWVREGTLDPKIESALKTMHPGQLSDPIRTDKGFDIVFLRDVHQAGADMSSSATKETAPAPQPQAASVSSKPETIVHLKQITIPIDPHDPAPVIDAKMNRAVTLKGEIASCEQMDKKSKDFQSPGTTDMGSGPLSSLPEPVRRAVENLPVGTLSPPVRGDNGVAVLMVCDRHEVPGQAQTAAAVPVPAPTPAPAPKGPGLASLDDDGSRDKVANQIGMKRLDQMQEHYLRDLRATAFIDKRI